MSIGNCAYLKFETVNGNPVAINLKHITSVSADGATTGESVWVHTQGDVCFQVKGEFEEVMRDIVNAHRDANGGLEKAIERAVWDG